jgi:glycosyltransferase involved in cell wall biosynthesis
VRVSLDATPLLGSPTGVGRYVDRLVDALVGIESADARLQLTLVPFTVRGAGGLLERAGVRVRHRPFPARVLRAVWSRASFPPVEVFAGRCDVFDATNFVLPPTRRAVGVVTIHDLTWALHPDTVTKEVEAYQRLVPESVLRAALVLCPSNSTSREVREFFDLPVDRVRCTPLGVDPSWSRTSPPTKEQRARLQLPERFLLFVGAREPRKNVPILVRAHEVARQMAPDLVPDLVFAGPPGWGQEAVEQSASVRTTGYVSNEDLRLTVAGADCLVLPSRYEGFGLPLLEAFACGTPVVTTDIPVHREVTGNLASLVQVGDVDGLAEAIVTTLGRGRDPEADARRRAWASAWTWQRCAELTRQAYDDAQMMGKP